MKDDWSFIPIQSARDDPPLGQTRLYVVQTCRWRDDWDEDACWSPVDGMALAAFDDFVRAKWDAGERQRSRGERLGLIEVDVGGVLAAEVYLVKESGARYPLRCWQNPGFEGRTLAVFADRRQAEQDILARDKDDWRCRCEQPVYFSLEWTSLPPTILGDLLLDLGITPCPVQDDRYSRAASDWWKQTAPLIDGWQRERLLRALDRFSNYRVVPVPLAE
jgi:hypothetical protein